MTRATEVDEPAHSFDDSAAYERFMGRWSSAAGSKFLDWLSAPLGARWLDVGCGTGVFTELIFDRCAPAAISGVDPAATQIEHSKRQPFAQFAHFRVAPAELLPFPSAAFDVVSSALVFNFIADKPKALFEMRRVACAGGIIAAYIWDFSAELSPSWPLRVAMRKFGIDVPDVPGTRVSGLDAIRLLFEQAGLQNVTTTTIDVSLSYRDFSDFWLAQMPSYSPTTKIIAEMADSERARLIDIVRTGLHASTDGAVEYSARANAIRGMCPLDTGSR